MAGKQIGATLVLREGNFFANITKAKGATESFEKSITKNMKSLTSLAKKAVGAAAAYASFDTAKDFLTDCVTGIMELGRANERLSTLMLNTKGNTQEMADGIITYGDELERITSIEGDATVAGASQLATFQLQGDTIKALLPSLQNLAVAQNGVDVSQDNMISSANLLGKVMQGQTGALSKAGVSFSEQQKKILQTGTEAQKTATLIEVLDQNFGGLAESMAQTDEGKVIQLRNAWGSVKDEVGMAVMPVISGAVDYLHTNIPSIRDKVTSAIDFVSPYVATAINGIKTGCEGASEVVGFVSENWNLIAPAVYGVTAALGLYKLAVMGCTIHSKALTAATKLKTFFMTSDGAIMSAYTALHWGLSAGYGPVTAGQMAFNAALKANPIGTVVTLIGLLIGVGVLLYKNWDTVKAKAIEIGGKVKEVFGGIRDFVGGVWQSIKDGARGMVNGVISGLNVLIRGANKLQFDVPEGVPVIGGLKFGLNIPEIPMLASGGIIRSPGSVLVGERGPEILNLGRGASVIPLDRAGSGGTTNHNAFHITIQTNELDDAAIDRFIGKVKFAMANM